MPAGVTPAPRRSLQGARRRIVHVVLFEAIAVAVTSGVLAWLVDWPVETAAATTLGTSAIAMLWNWAWNVLFERWEMWRRTGSQQHGQHGRSALRRLGHAAGFELGLTLLLLPLFVYLLNISLQEALAYNLGLVAFFIAYGFVFNLAFDRLFGLPASATGQGSPSQ